MNNNTIKVEAQIVKLTRYNEDWCLGKAYILKSDSKTVLPDETITIKGVFPKIQGDGIYTLVVVLDDNTKYGEQYKVISVSSVNVLNKDDIKGKRKFLSSLFTQNQINNMYDCLEDPYQVMLEKNYAALSYVKGCKLKTAQKWIEKFHKNIKITKILTELESFHLTNSMVDKLLARYGSDDMVVLKIKNNPYILANDVTGIGWKTADKIAMQSGISFDSPKRIYAYMMHKFEICMKNGYSWITPDELLSSIIDELGEEVPDKVISEVLVSLIEKNIIWHDQAKTKLALTKAINIEEKVAAEIVRLLNAESKITYSGWDEKIKNIEEKNGWQYTKEQLEGIKTGLDNNITIITGYAGTGKSSIISGILTILDDYSFCQTALAGRAASKLKEITGSEGYTIHRLLGFPMGDKNQFVYHDENPLPYDIYIIDEISMIDLYLFYYLLRAIPSGSKVFFLGDIGQLESIGCGNVASDMIHSGVIPVCNLTKIHRQAEKSAIVTESIKIRNGIQIVEKGFVGERVLGELQDLTLICNSDVSNTFYNIMKVFNDLYHKEDFCILDTQIIVPMKNLGNSCTYVLNNAIQELVNKNYKNEIIIQNAGNPYALRIGDKVINTSNNYDLDVPIYNGNIGIIKDILFDYEKDEEVIVIDFGSLGIVSLEKKYWNSIELAYAITTHKMQGSSAKYVIYAIDYSNYAMLNREQVYTGVTRARKHCYLIAQTSALRSAIFQEEVSKKRTFLKDLLYNFTHPKLVF